MHRDTRFTFSMLFATLLTMDCANAFIVDFDSEGLTGPSLASQTSAGNVVVSTPIGNVTFSGGAILTAESNLPADTTSVYYTSFFLSGGKNPITVTFPQNINNFFLDVFNGQTSAEAFTVADNTGQSNTVTLANNTAGGTALISFPAVGNVITISTKNAAGFDFSIDKIGFDQPTPTVPEPEAWVLVLAGITVLGFGGYRRQSRVASAA